MFQILCIYSKIRFLELEIKLNNKEIMSATVLSGIIVDYRDEAICRNIMKKREVI